MMTVSCGNSSAVLRRILAVLLFIGASSSFAAAQSGASIEAWIRARMWRIESVEPLGSTNDLAQLRPLIGGARVVALGEPSHGNHEPLAFRNRLFQFLVEQMGFTAIALETGFAEAKIVQDFIAGGDGSAVDVVRDGLTYGFGQYQENVALVQ